MFFFHAVGLFTNVTGNAFTFVKDIFTTFVNQMSTIMNTRLQQFLAAENLTQAQFADSINVARASVSPIIAGRNNPGYDFIINTMKRYPDLNVEWLLLGKGKMYRSVKQDSTDTIRKDTVPEMPSSIPDLDLGLFPEPQEETPDNAAPPRREVPADAPQSDIAVHDTATVPDIAAPSDMDTAGKPSQSAARQRKAIKIIVFYDDGTYQEF